MSREKPTTIDPGVAHTLTLLLGELGDRGVEASGVAYATGTVQITLKPETPAEMVRVHDALFAWMDGFAHQEAL